MACYLPGYCIVCSASVLPDRPSEEWSPESKKREMTKLGTPSAVEPHSGQNWEPLMPMVFPEHNYVRVVLVSQSREGWGWGRTAMLARNVPDGLFVGYSGSA